jgi:PTH1 family peptidyl-tRNA hydrolase
MFLIVGLGNPGLKYQHTKHNFGFMLCDQIVSDYNLRPTLFKKNNLVFSGEIKGRKIIVVKPQEYMNNSGASLQSIISFFKIPIENIIVLHDDLDLDLGRVKAKIGGGNAGHNGLRSIDSNIGKNYKRLRLGIGRPENINYEISNYVLSKFTKDELSVVSGVNSKLSELISLPFDGDLDKLINEFYK